MAARRSWGAVSAAGISLMLLAVAVACGKATPTETPGVGANASAVPDANLNPNVDADASATANADASVDTGAAPMADGTDAGGPGATPREAGTTEAASGNTDGGAKERAVRLDESAAGKTVEVAVGQRLVVTLGANPTTGFDWSVLKAPSALGTPEMAYDSSGNQPGAPGTRRLTWTLKGALPAGEHSVELGYARSFEKGVAPFKTFKFKVRAAR